LANTLNLGLVKVEAAKGARTTNPDANDLIMRRLALMNDQTTHIPKERKDMSDAARALFEQALAIDPNYAAAIAGVAETYFMDYMFGWGNSGTDYEAKYSVRQTARSISLEITTYRIG
jgi:hypothetical protein